MILVGCDLHTRKQQVALLNTDTGELWEQELSHGGDDVERFYAALPPPVTVGIESTGLLAVVPRPPAAAGAVLCSHGQNGSPFWPLRRGRLQPD